MNFFQILMRNLGRASCQERAKGNVSRANGIALIALGLFLLPIPFIGLPLIIFGLVKVCG